MDLQPILDALARAKPDGVGIRDWSIYASESQRLTLGTKDRQTGNAHSPLTIHEGAGANYLVVWDDGRVSRGYLERRQVETDAIAAFSTAPCRNWPGDTTRRTRSSRRPKRGASKSPLATS